MSLHDATQRIMYTIVTAKNRPRNREMGATAPRFSPTRAKLFSTRTNTELLVVIVTLAFGTPKLELYEQPAWMATPRTNFDLHAHVLKTRRTFTQGIYNTVVRVMERTLGAYCAHATPGGAYILTVFAPRRAFQQSKCNQQACPRWCDASARYGQPVRFLVGEREP